MNKKYFLLLLFGLLGSASSAQTLNQAKEWYDQERYEEAKPVFRKLMKSQPANGKYNLWYGVCCLKTGEAEEALKPLQTAVKRRTPSGQLYLAQAYDAVYRYEEAIETYEAYIKDLARRKRPTDEADQLLERCKSHFRMLKGVEQVCIVDSFVVDKADFLKAYRISPESGKLYTNREHFAESDKRGGTVYETELGNRMYYSEEQPDSTLSIVVSNKMLDSWSSGKLLPESINGSMNANYPYVMTDGVTIYYAADGPASLGGYDIFVTRFNTNTDSYLTPDNVGMPFNSPYNDYMYVVDEFNNLGWFASDRYQPEDKVCVYVFIPNSSKQVYNYETMDKQQLIRLAQIKSIADTWIDTDALEAARQRLKQAIEVQPITGTKHDFCFVIDDATDYHQLDDFRSPKAKEAFKHYQQLSKSLHQLHEKLQQMRDMYAAAFSAKKQELSVAILDLEKRVAQLDKETERAAVAVRQLEKSTRR